MILAVVIIVAAEQIHGSEQLVGIDQRANHDQTAQDIPAPEGTGAEGIGDAPAGQLIADAVRDLVVPDKGRDA